MTTDSYIGKIVIVPITKKEVKVENIRSIDNGRIKLAYLKDGTVINKNILTLKKEED